MFYFLGEEQGSLFFFSPLSNGFVGAEDSSPLQSSPFRIKQRLEWTSYEQFLKFQLRLGFTTAAI